MLDGWQHWQGYLVLDPGPVDAISFELGDEGTTLT